MSRTPAKFTQTDLARALRAAQSVDESLAVRVLLDGSIEVYRRPSGPKDEPVDENQRWVF